MEERATLRHKTVSKKLRFYDQTNTKESEVRRTQNLESQKLRAKVDMNKDQGNFFRVIDVFTLDSGINIRLRLLIFEKF